jgi:hypothetical protein
MSNETRTEHREKPPWPCWGFHNKIYSDGLVFKGMNVGLVEALIREEIPMPSRNLRQYGESHPKANYVGNLGEAIQVSRLWEGSNDSAVVAFEGRVFNRMKQRGEAAVGKMEAAEFDYPYLAVPLPLRDVSYVFVGKQTKEWLDAILEGSGNDEPAGLREALKRYLTSGFYGRVIPIRADETSSDEIAKFLLEYGHTHAQLVVDNYIVHNSTGTSSSFL